MIFGSIVLGVAGALVAFVGFADQHAADTVYTVGFGRPGDDCSGGAVKFDVADGAPLACARSAAGAYPSVRFPGFSDEQNRAVADLARDRGTLTEQDQADIQTLVDGFSAPIPEEQRMQYAHVAEVGPFWGLRMALVGIAAMAGAGLLWLRAKRA